MGRRVAIAAAAMAAGVCLLSQHPAAQRRSGVVAVTAQDRAGLRDWDGTIDAMVRSGELASRLVRQDTVLQGRSHQRYDQYADGIRVVGGDLARQTANGLTQSIFGHVYDVGDLTTRPTLSEEDARARFEKLSGRELPANRPIELVILPKGDGGFALTYVTYVESADGWMLTHLDAHTGVVALQYSDLQTQSAVGSGTGVLGDRKKISTTTASGRFLADDALRPPRLITYDMQGDPAKVLRFRNGTYIPTMSDVASDTDNIWTDGANVDAHVYLGWTYDYYFKRFNRRSLDDRDTPILGVTHPISRLDGVRFFDIFDEFVVNAFWCSQCGAFGAMVFGEGLPPGFTLGGQYYDYLAGGLDVVAHELTHGLTNYSSRLIYLNESGALNESFSDVLGTSAEFFYQLPGTGLRQADYTIGEDVVRPGGFRSMSNPVSFGDPDHYSRRFTGTADNGGVHTNSAIPNQAFYLAIESGTNRTSGLAVQGVGPANREQIEKVFYRAFVFMLPSNATFSMARAATIQAARDLYGVGSAAERAVTQAWTAVGVN
jgi:Zn-dependent metalloprotease